MKLKDKVAIVTGGARGIGKSACLELAKEGARIAVNYVKSKEKADEVVKEIKALGSDAVSVQADVSNEADVEKLVSKTLEAFGRIDILVNNAGVLGHTDGMKFDKKVWDSVMGTNLMGALHCIQHAAKPMLEQKSGVIVNVSSISGTNCFGDFFEYEVSKAALNALTRFFAVKLGPDIRVNSVAPGGTDTDMALEHLTEESRQAYIQKAPLKKRAKPEEIAKVIVFLASEDSSNMTGQILVSDSGFSLV